MVKGNGDKLKRSYTGPKSDSIGNIRLIQWGVAVGLLFCLTFLLIPRGTLPSKPLAEGDIVPRDIKASRDILVEDIDSTAKIKQAAAESVKEVFDLDPKLAGRIAKKVQTALESVRKGYDSFATGIESSEKSQSEAPTSTTVESAPPSLKETKAELAKLAAQFEKTPAFKTLEADFFTSLGIKSSPSLVKFLRSKRYDPALASDIGSLLQAAMARGIVSNIKVLESQANKGILIQEVGERGLQEVSDVNRFWNLKEAQKSLPELANNIEIVSPPKEKRFLVVLVSQLLEPNLTVNKQATETLREKAIQDAKPVYFQIKKGEMIAREGERLTPQQLVKIKGFAAQEEKRGFLSFFLGTALLIALALTLASIYLLRFKSKLMQSPRRIILMGVMLLGTMVVVQVFLHVGLTFAESLGNVEASNYFYAIPFATGAMLAAILLDLEVALLFSALTAFLSGLLLPHTFGLPLTALVGGLVVSFRINYYRRRSSILLTGMMVGVTNIAVIVPLNLLDGTLLSTEGWFSVLMGVIGGVVTGIVVSAILPLLESMFNIVSDNKLLELGDLNHPLLRQLVMNAPGTYHHSVVVSNMAEEAADLIGANSLLVRVAAYYHDIGKSRKPEYFIENQSGTENKHDRLSPRMSALILISHVKDGIEMARKHNLPEQIIDFIPQHHGTSLISYFYNKAKEIEDSDQQKVKEEDFRYPGPKPQSRETGILLLADGVEAVSRTLHDPTPARIQTTVRSHVARIFADGQLDDCELTLRDLNLISKAFARILTGIFHQRVVYPEVERQGQLELEAHLDADFSDQPAAHSQDRPAVDREASPEAVKTSGLPARRTERSLR